MKDVIMYKTKICPFCARAERLLKSKGVENIKMYDITSDTKLMNEMLEKSGGQKTVPQIFIDGKHIGGYSDLVNLDKEAKLDELLK